MSENADARLESYLRAELARHPRPVVASGLATRVVVRVAERDRLLRPRPRRARVLLGAYWLATALACASILARTPLPDWGASILLGLAVVLAPLGYAAALWPAQARAWLTAALRPIAPDADR